MTKRSASVDLNIPMFIRDEQPPCAEVDPELFFPQEVEISPTKIVSVYADASAAKKICYSCPLMSSCLEYALRGQEVGIWGGMTERQRDQLRKRNRLRISTPNS